MNEENSDITSNHATPPRGIILQKNPSVLDESVMDYPTIENKITDYRLLYGRIQPDYEQACRTILLQNVEIESLRKKLRDTIELRDSAKEWTEQLWRKLSSGVEKTD